jgi:hypothetical protein
MIAPDKLRDIFDYDPTTGNLVWKVRNSKRVKIGDIAGCKSTDGRILIGLNGRLYKAHRIIWALVTGEWPKNFIDHKNSNPSDNKWENLREATKSQNMMNVGKIKSNTSGIRGVGWSKASQKWRAYIRANHQDIHLGVFENLEDAQKARIEAEKQYHGEFAPHQNRPSL